MFELRLLGTTDLRRNDDVRVHSVLAQPKRFALLAYLAMAAPGAYVRRDRLLALFWPESDEARARAALRKAIHYLRQSLGDEVVLGSGTEEVAIDPDLLRCDAARVRAMIDAGRLEEGLQLYTGELMPGFHIDGSPAFDEWLEAERASLRRMTAEAATRLARQARDTGDLRAAAAWQRQAHDALPEDEDILRDALLVLVDSGQRSAALELLAVHRRRFEQLGLPVDQALDTIVRSAAAVGIPVVRSPSDEAMPARATTDTPAPVSRAGERAHPRSSAISSRHVFRTASLLAAAVVLALLFWKAMSPPDRRAAADAQAPLVAIGAIHDFTADADSLGRLVPELLATNLARAPRLRVVSPARLREIVVTAVPAGGGIELARAARIARADELVEGALYELPDGRLRLDLRRVRLHDGELLQTYRVSGSNPFELVDRATATLAFDIGGFDGDPLRVGDVTTRSLVALRFYQEGLTAYFQGDGEAASRLFNAALDEDSTFAMAAYFAGLANSPNGPLRIRYLRRAQRLADRTTDRERLLIRATLAHYMNDPEQTAIADTLVRRYPDEPAAQLLYGRSLIVAGRFAEALPPLRRAIALDSLSLHRDAGPCRACEALVVMGLAYLYLDSTVAAERVMRRAYESRLETQAYAGGLVQALVANGKYAETDERLRRAGEGVMSAEEVARGLITNDIRRGAFERADAALHSVIANSAPGFRSMGRWLLVISLRNQGRLEDALAVVEEERRDRQGEFGFPPTDVLMAATILFERGDYARAAVLYDSIAATVPRDNLIAWNRNTAWNLTHAANAHVAAGRLEIAARIAERVRVVGAGSGYGRDPRLHHHIRGLIAAARGDHRTAIAEFRKAIYSVASGYTRTNVELARSLLTQGRAGEAVAVLDPPLRNGGLQSMLYYATRTELHALLGEAYLQGGQLELARTHLDEALHALRNADPAFAGRIAHLRSLRARAE